MVPALKSSRVGTEVGNKKAPLYSHMYGVRNLKFARNLKFTSSKQVTQFYEKRRFVLNFVFLSSKSLEFLYIQQISPQFIYFVSISTCGKFQKSAEFYISCSKSIWNSSSSTSIFVIFKFHYKVFAAYGIRHSSHDFFFVILFVKMHSFL